MLKNKLLSAMGGAPANYIEDVCSTYLYTGNGSTQTINNGIDLSTKGGLVWCKSRNNAGNNFLSDTVRGASKYLRSNLTNAELSVSGGISFTSSGFYLDGNPVGDNVSGYTYASWTFRKQPKFFDVVTWTGTFDTNRRISHSLGSVPGCIIVKRTDTTGQWWVYHASRGRDKYLQLQATNAEGTFTNAWGTTDPTATDFGFNETFFTPAAGGTYVAYLFAHNAGGFGLTGTDNVISCGSFTNNASVVNVNLGYEPQWVLYKNASQSTGWNWAILDNMRGWVDGGPAASDDAFLFPNLSNAEVMSISGAPTATGFRFDFSTTGTDTFIYIAIRRGPMKVPTDGTKVFAATKVDQVLTTDYTHTDGFNPDLVTFCRQDNRVAPFLNGCNFIDRLRGNGKLLACNSTAADATDVWVGFDVQKAHKMLYGSPLINSAATSSYVSHAFRRAPGFFDEVCYTGTGVARTVAHNLGVAPELMIVKARSISGFWYVFVSSLGADRAILLNSNGIGASSSSYWNSTMPTSTVFSLNDVTAMNGAGSQFVAYLFASCPGVSKVGSYTGTGATQQINCGFTAGARFVLIKRTDSTGDWYVWDSARGIVTGNDPYLLLNSTAAEVTTTDYIDPYSAGFEISSTAPAAINASGGTFIYLAIA